MKTTVVVVLDTSEKVVDSVQDVYIGYTVAQVRRLYIDDLMNDDEITRDDAEMMVDDMFHIEAVEPHVRRRGAR